MDYSSHIGALREEIRTLKSRGDWQRQRIDRQQKQIDRLLEHLGLSLNKPSDLSYQEGVLEIRSDSTIQVTGDPVVRFHERRHPALLDYYDEFISDKEDE